MSYRGMENFYGNVYKWIDGLITGTNQIAIGNKSFNNTGSGYTIYNKTFSGAGGYISDIFGDKQLGFIPNTFAGSTTTKLYDYGTLAASCLPIFGGSYNCGLDCGAFLLYVCYSAAGSNSSFGARLTY